MALQITGLRLPQISPEEPPSAFPTVQQPELSRHPSLDIVQDHSLPASSQPSWRVSISLECSPFAGQAATSKSLEMNGKGI